MLLWLSVWMGCIVDAALVCCCCLQCYFALLLTLFAARDEGSKLGMLIAICGGGFFVRLHDHYVGRLMLADSVCCYDYKVLLA